MTFVLSGTAATALVVGGATAYSAYQGGKAADKAAAAQTNAAQLGINEQRTQFDAIKELLSPYAETGNVALTKQGDFLGLNGSQPQQAILDSVQNSPYFQSMSQQGSNAILQNASATGGLRGGNTQDALAKFQPALLQQVLEQYYTRLGGLSSQGENAAAMTGNAGVQAGSNISNLYQQQGAAIAGGALAQGKEQAGYANAITSGLGAFTGLGGKF